MLKEKITKDLKDAQKQKDTSAVSALRMLLSEIKNKEIEKKDELTDSDVQKIISKQVKQHNDSIEQFEEAGRDDLVKNEKKQLSIIEKYMPEQLSEDELVSVIEEVVKQLGASDMSDMGGVMNKVMSKVQGQAEGSKVSELVKKKLS